MHEVNEVLENPSREHVEEAVALQELRQLEAAEEGCLHSTVEASPEEFQNNKAAYPQGEFYKPLCGEGITGGEAYPVEPAADQYGWRCITCLGLLSE